MRPFAFSLALELNQNNFFVEISNEILEVILSINVEFSVTAVLCFDSRSRDLGFNSFTFQLNAPVQSAGTYHLDK